MFSRLCSTFHWLYQTLCRFLSTCTAWTLGFSLICPHFFILIYISFGFTSQWEIYLKIFKKKNPNNLELLLIASGVWAPPCRAGIASSLVVQLPLCLFSQLTAWTEWVSPGEPAAKKPLPVSFVGTSELGKASLTGGSFDPEPFPYLIQSCRHFVAWLTSHFSTLFSTVTHCLLVCMQLLFKTLIGFHLNSLIFTTKLFCFTFSNVLEDGLVPTPWCSSLWSFI